MTLGQYPWGLAAAIYGIKAARSLEFLDWTKVEQREFLISICKISVLDYSNKQLTRIRVRLLPFNKTHLPIP